MEVFINMKEIIIKIENVTKKFGAFSAIDDISLDIPKGSFTTLLGPSGCGKTTLMRLIAGFYEPDAGSIYIEGNRVNGVPAFKRNTPLVFQEYALFPHMTVKENISYGLKLQKASKKEIQEKVTSMLDMFGLQGLESRYPEQLSGGQQQRVAFARALIMGQNVILMDEPLSNLDAKMRIEVRNELRQLQQRFGFTAIFVTHDQEEAMAISDHIAVFNKGQICQVGTPWDIYFKPESKFVADFVGAANFIAGEIFAIEDSEIVVKCNEAFIRVNKSSYQVEIGQKITLVIRPECISITAEERDHQSSQHVIIGNIVKSSFLGRSIRYWVEENQMQWIVDDANPAIQGPLQGKVSMSLDHSKIHLLPEQAAVTVNRKVISV